METIVSLEPIVEPWIIGIPSAAPATTGLVELMLKDQRGLDAFIRDESRAPDLIPRLLTVALVGFTIFGAAATVIVNLGGAVPRWMPSARWSDGAWASLTLAYVLGLVAATGVCLPSFYFYGLLARLPAGPPRLLPASADAGLVRLLYGRHTRDDLLALDAARRLTAGRSPSPAGPGGGQRHGVRRNDDLLSRDRCRCRDGSLPVGPGP